MATLGKGGGGLSGVLLTNFSGLLDVHPLAVILQQELVAAWGVLEGNAVDGPGAKDSHSCCRLHTPHIASQHSTAQHACECTLYNTLNNALHEILEHRVHYRRQSQVVLLSWCCSSTRRWGVGERRGGGYSWSRPVTPTSLSPGHTPKMVPTVKLVSTMEEPSKGSKATLNPSPADMIVIALVTITSKSC